MRFQIDIMIFRRLRNSFSVGANRREPFVVDETTEEDEIKAPDGFMESYDVHVGLEGDCDQFVYEHWQLGQISHRPNGPAKILSVRETGQVLEEEYRYFGFKHREDGPAVTEIDPDTRVVTREEYYKHGKLHNKSAPAIILRDGKTGEVTSETYYQDGVQAGLIDLDIDRSDI